MSYYSSSLAILFPSGLGAAAAIITLHGAGHSQLLQKQFYVISYFWLSQESIFANLGPQVGVRRPSVTLLQVHFVQLWSLRGSQDYDLNV